MYQAFFFIFSIVFLLPFQRKNPPRSQATLRCLREIFSNAIFEYANYVNLQVVLMADYSALNWASKRFCRKGILGGKPGNIYMALWLKAITLGGHRTGTWHYKAYIYLIRRFSVWYRCIFLRVKIQMMSYYPTFSFPQNSDLLRFFIFRAHISRARRPKGY